MVCVHVGRIRNHVGNIVDVGIDHFRQQRRDLGGAKRRSQNKITNDVGDIPNTASHRLQFRCIHPGCVNRDDRITGCEDSGDVWRVIGNRQRVERDTCRIGLAIGKQVVSLISGQGQNLIRQLPTPFNIDRSDCSIAPDLADVQEGCINPVEVHGNANGNRTNDHDLATTSDGLAIGLLGREGKRGTCFDHERVNNIPSRGQGLIGRIDEIDITIDGTNQTDAWANVRKVCVVLKVSDNHRARTVDGPPTGLNIRQRQGSACGDVQDDFAKLSAASERDVRCHPCSGSGRSFVLDANDIDAAEVEHSTTQPCDDHRARASTRDGGHICR